MTAGPGFFDARGIRFFGEDDQRALFSDTLNLGMQSVSDVAAQLMTQQANLENLVKSGGIDYTPVVSGISGGTKKFQYFVGGDGRIDVSGSFTLSGSAVAGPLLLSLPGGVGNNGNYSTLYGSAFFLNAADGKIYSGIVRRYDNTRVTVEAIDTAAAYARYAPIAAAVPFAWTNGSLFVVKFSFVPA